MTKQGRGVLTARIKTASKKLLGAEINQLELRLIPYLHYTATNSQRIDPNAINADERAVLAKWRAAGYISGGATGLGISKEFWTFMNAMLWLGYVDIDKEA
jgi:hypothetical protein